MATFPRPGENIIRVLSGGKLNYRQSPEIRSDNLIQPQIEDRELVTVLDGDPVLKNNYYWAHLLRGDRTGYAAWRRQSDGLQLTDYEPVERYHDLLWVYRGDGRAFRVQNNRGSSEVIWTKRIPNSASWYHVKNQLAEAMYADGNWIYRTLDTSPEEQGRVYTVDGAVMRRFVKVGETIETAPQITWRWVANGRALTPAELNNPNPYTHAQRVKLVAAYDLYTFEGGKVVRFVYEFEIFVGGQLVERAWYAPGYGGPVAFESLTTGFKSWITEDLPGSSKREPSFAAWMHDYIVIAPEQDIYPPPDHAPAEPEPEESPMPQLDIDTLESNQDYIQRWANPRFVHDANWHQTRLPQGDPNGVIISYPSDWGFFIADGSSQATVAQTLNAGSTELKMDVAQKLIYQGPEKVASQLQLTWPGTYLFLWRVGTLLSASAQNLQYGLRIHMADGTVYGFSDHPGETRLFPTFNGQDHSGVWGLLVNIPEPQNVQSAGLLARTNAEGVQGEMFWRYVNAFYAPQDIVASDLGIGVGIIGIPATGEPTPQPEPEPEPTPEPTPPPSGNALANLLRDIGVALIDYADDVD